MAVYRFESEIGKDHRLDIPSEVPSGPAQIVVIPQSTPVHDWENLRQFIRDMAEGPQHTRSKEEIDQYIRHERDSWE
jgi:hypothetical protein